MGIKHRALAGLLVLTSVLALPGATAAQVRKLKDLLPDLLTRGLNLNAELRGGANHSADFDSEEDQGRTANAINDSLRTQLASSPPVSSSAGGYVWTEDPTLGVPVRATDSFGPIFAERAQTIGKGKWNFGFSTFRFDYDSIDDLSLSEGDLSFNLAHKDGSLPGPLTNYWEGDYVLGTAFIDLTSETLTFFGTVGVTDRLDLGIAVPRVTVDLEARVVYTLVLSSTADDEEQRHAFPDGLTQQVFPAAGDANGLGDVLLRAKYLLLNKDNKAFAAALDVRLPTGDEDDLLGSGATQTKLVLIGSAQYGKFHPHVNLGYTLSSDSALPDEVNWAVGFDSPVHKRVTFAADLAGRTLLGATRVLSKSRAFLFQTDPDGPDPTGPRLEERPFLEAEETDLDLFFGSLGVKLELREGLLATANVLSSLSSHGLQDEDLIGLIGFDVSF